MSVEVRSAIVGNGGFPEINEPSQLENEAGKVDSIAREKMEALEGLDYLEASKIEGRIGACAIVGGVSGGVITAAIATAAGTAMLPFTLSGVIIGLIGGGIAGIKISE